MKKVIVLFFALLLSMILYACGNATKTNIGSETETSTSSNIKAAVETSSIIQPSSKSYGSSKSSSIIQSSSKSYSSSKSSSIPANKMGTRKNPVPLNKAATFNGMNDIFDTFTADLTLTEVIRGTAAWDIIKKGNPFNAEPPAGKEYLLVKVKIKAIDSKDDEKIDINESSFDLINKSGVKYDDFVVVAGVKPSLSTMYAGAEQEAYVPFLVDINDIPSVVFLERVNGGLWFSIT